MVYFITTVFVLTYAGMASGWVPGLKLDRTGIALLAAIALFALGALPQPDFLNAVNFPTLAILFGLMILAGQFGFAGFYDWCAARIAAAAGRPAQLLALTVLISGLLSALLANDIVVFAVTPILCEGLRRRDLDARPFLAGLAGAANAGSAATVIGNPQNILIGQFGRLGFWHFLAVCGPPALVALLLTYGAVLIAWWPTLRQTPAKGVLPAITLDRWQMGKSLVAMALLITLFSLPVARDTAALAIAAALLISRRIPTRQALAAVDWNLILLFASLFVVNAAFSHTGLPALAVAAAERHALLPDHLGVLAPLSALLSNTIGNVPAVILLLSHWPNPSQGALYGLALLSTLAGNLFLVGSIANIIVAERAARNGISFGVADHARAGVPMALTSMAVAALWLLWGGWMPWH